MRKIHRYTCISMLCDGVHSAENVRGIQNHVWAYILNNVGTEASRGDLCALETYQLLSCEDESIHFGGNVARDLMDGVADVVVADGFTAGKRCLENDGRERLLGS